MPCSGGRSLPQQQYQAALQLQEQRQGGLQGATTIPAQPMQPMQLAQDSLTSFDTTNSQGARGQGAQPGYLHPPPDPLGAGTLSLTNSQTQVLRDTV